MKSAMRIMYKHWRKLFRGPPGTDGKFPKFPKFMADEVLKPVSSNNKVTKKNIAAKSDALEERLARAPMKKLLLKCQKGTCIKINKKPMEFATEEEKNNHDKLHCVWRGCKFMADSESKHITHWREEHREYPFLSNVSDEDSIAVRCRKQTRGVRCAETFASNDEMVTHWVLHCFLPIGRGHCNFVAHFKDDLVSHIEKGHGEVFDCIKGCGIAWSSQHELAEHQSSHCPEVSYPFISENDELLREHIIREHVA
ncbi:hypothetical protein BCON_0461g00020 [Botryotinia convoluta]|uniref:C2H2-type domain-containing protein n=1 Tax=Botryotinia convoluta TaxID=54673 RepID=A0A4Z1H9C0_9HELO|nr:hypothetical protein BCON_0461g00020 [Botryotinia convoluta]